MTLVLTETCDDIDLSDSHCERRRGLRIRQARPVKVYETSGTKYFGGRTEDISATGLRIELPASAALQPGKLLSVHVGLNRGGSMLANRRSLIPARVVWIAQGRSMAYVSAGVEFIASIAAHLDAA